MRVVKAMPPTGASSHCTLNLPAAAGRSVVLTSPSFNNGLFGCCAGSFNALTSIFAVLWRENGSAAYSWPLPDTNCGPHRVSFGCIFEPITSCSLDASWHHAVQRCSASVRFNHYDGHCRWDMTKRTYQMMPRLLRLLPHVRRLVDERKRALQLPRRYVALQMRGGDKPGTESVYMSPRSFLNAALDAAPEAYPSAFETIFVMTDDYSMVEGLRSAVSSTTWRIATMAPEASRMAGKTAAGYGLLQATPIDNFVQFWAESEVAAEATVLVGSEASNVGRWLKTMRADLSPSVPFHNVDPPVGITRLRNSYATSYNRSFHTCSRARVAPKHAVCNASWNGVVVALHSDTSTPANQGRLSNIGDAVLELMDAASVLLAAGVPFRLGGHCKSGAEAWRSDWSCAFNPSTGECPATRSMSSRSIIQAANHPDRLSHLYQKLGVRTTLPANKEEHLLRACMALSLTPFALGYGHMVSMCSRMQVRRVILRRHLCLRMDVRQIVDALKPQLMRPWIEHGKREYIEASPKQSLKERRHLYDAFQMQREHLQPQPSNLSLGASMMHALYRSLSRWPYYGPAGSGTSPRQQDFGLFILADDARDVRAAELSVGGFPETFFARYTVGVNFVTDPMTHDPYQRPASDRDAFAHLWASVELAAEARWLFTTASSPHGSLVEAVREPSEREYAVRVTAAEEPSS